MVKKSTSVTYATLLRNEWQKIMEERTKRFSSFHEENRLEKQKACDFIYYHVISHLFRHELICKLFQ